MLFLGDWEDAFVVLQKARKLDIREVGQSGMDETLKEEVRDLVQKLVREASTTDRAILEALRRRFCPLYGHKRNITAGTSSSSAI